MTLIVLAVCSACNDAPTVPAAPPLDAAARVRGRALYRQYCALCHGVGADGRGVRHEGLGSAPADFTRASFSAQTPPARAFAHIRDGVPGTAMPAWRALSDDEMWALVAYVRSVGKEGP